jgi:thioredoxin 1
MAVNITDASFDELVTGQQPAVIDFWAEWCGPCRAIAPIVEELAEEYAGRVLIGKVNIDENEDLTDTFGIRSVPTLLFFKDGQIVDKHIGGITRAALEEKVKSLL